MGAVVGASVLPSVSELRCDCVRGLPDTPGVENFTSWSEYDEHLEGEAKLQAVPCVRDEGDERR